MLPSRRGQLGLQFPWKREISVYASGGECQQAEDLFRRVRHALVTRPTANACVPWKALRGSTARELYWRMRRGDNVSCFVV